MNKVYTKGHVVRTERHRDGQTRKARGKKPSLGYKDLFLTPPPTPKVQRQVMGKSSRMHLLEPFLNLPLLILGDSS